MKTQTHIVVHEQQRLLHVNVRGPLQAANSMAVTHFASFFFPVVV